MGVLFLLILACVGILFGLLSGNWTPMVGWLAVVFAGMLLFAVKSRSLQKPVRYGLLWTFGAYALVRGFLLKPLDSNAYPTNARVVKSK
jgi:FtsH-binding integral membrane protein